MHILRTIAVWALLVAFGWSSIAAAQHDNTQAESTNQPAYSGFGGPTSVSGQAADDAVTGPEYPLQKLQEAATPWFEWKNQFREGRGIQLNIDESLLYQAATDSNGNNEGASGLVRVFGQIDLLECGCNDVGALVFKGENRHRIGTGITPFDLGFQAGSATPTGTFFNDFDFGITNMYWKQTMFEQRLAFAVGQVDLTDFMDTYALMNPLTHFLNLAFSTNPTIASPNQGLGFAAGGMMTEHIYLLGGFSDANAVPTNAGFDTFFNDAEYFTFAEIGYTPSKDRLYLDGVHITLWHSDNRERAGISQGQGLTFSLQRFIDDKWLPFFRFGYSDGDASLMETTFSGGIGLLRENTDVAGIGISWGRPTSSPSTQFTSEVFYRRQLTQFLAITPDVQLIVDPVGNPATDVVALFGIRLRAAF